MSEFITIAAAADLKSGERIVVEVKDHYIAVFNVGGTYYAIEDICTHDDGPLAEGELTDHVIECPRHGAQFDIRSGKNLSLVAPRPVARYEVRIENGQVQILV